MIQLLQDLRYATRVLAKSPGFTAVAIGTLTLAIGANTAIFSVVNALLLNPYPFPQPDRIVLLDAQHVSGNNSATGYLDFLDWQRQNAVFDSMAIEPWTGMYSLTGNGEPRRVIGGATTAQFLRVLGVEPLRGRFFTPAEDKPGAPRLVVLSYAAWQRYFGGGADVIGRTITLDAEPFTVIGIMPRRFNFPGIMTCDFFTPLRESSSLGRRQHQYEVLARLKPAVTLDQAQANMTAIASRLAQAYPDTNKGWGVAVLPMRQALVAEARTPSAILSAIVIFVLLLACANLAGLLLARASGRAREIAIRVSLGAGRLRIVRQLLTESILLSLCGGAAGLLFAKWLMDILASAAPSDFGLNSALRLDPTVLAFTLLISVVTGIVFGLIPASYGSKADLNTALKSDANAGSRRHSRNRVQSTLVTGQVALTLVLLIGAGLLVRDLLVVLRMNTGLRIEHVLTFGLDPPHARYSTPQSNVGLYAEIIDALKRVPGVADSGAVGTLPMTGGFTGGAFEIEGRPKSPDWVDTMVQYNSVTPGYFRTMGILLLRGRDFDERDSATALPVAIINDTLARQFFPNDDPLGHRFRDDYDHRWRTIIGIVGSIKNQQPMRAPVPGLYAPHSQKPWPWMTVVVRTQGDPAKLAATAQSIVHATDHELLILRMRTMKQVVADSMSEPELLAAFLAAFAGFALLLAAIGIYGTMAYSVSQRTHEMGIRMALGATRGDILKLTLSRSSAMAGAGIALGLIAALALSRLIGSLLYGIGPRDATVFLAVPLLVLAVALAASCLPARRAMGVDPMAALRHE
jgi:putative ABC transport system permease protein